MKKRTFAMLLALCMVFGLAACGSTESVPAASAVSAEEPAAAEEAPAEEPAPVEASEAEEPAPESEVSAVEEMPVEEASAPEEASVPEEAPSGTCTVTFSDGSTFEATIGEDFVFFFQCDAPGDMGQPAEGEEGAGITTADGVVTYSNVGLGGPYSYPTSELVTISGFTGDFEITICEEATNMGATYTIYVDEQEIADAIAFAEQMAAAMAENPMPPME